MKQIGAAVLLAGLSIGGAQADVKPFTFVHFSDPHIGGPENYHRLVQALEDVKSEFPEAAFVIVTGDCTEFGFEDELTSYAETLRAYAPVPVHSAPGNHDSRWSDSGKENFRRLVGDTYKSFDHHGVRFILMDSSMLLEQYAHFDGLQLRRLEEELQSLPPDVPAVIAMHHPPLSPGKFFDNEQAFANLIRRYNVPLVLTGHGHAFMRYAQNGTAFCMGGSTYGGGRDQSAYAVYRVTPEEMTRLQRRFLRDKTTTDTTLATQRRTGQSLGIRPVPSPEGTKGMLSFEAFYEGAPDEPRACTYLIDNLLTGTSTADQGNAVTLDPQSLSPGIHQLIVSVDRPEGPADTASTEFTIGPAVPGQPHVTRAFPLLSGSQSHPSVDGDTLYVAANDGFVRAIDLATSDGTVLWQKHLNSEVVSAPVIAGDNLVVGSMDSHVYCLDKATGAERWKFKTGTAVFASPLISEGTIYIGSGDINLYALDLATGKEKWRFPARAHIKMTPALAGGKLFFGAWDNTFYAVNANDGSLVWKVPVGVTPPRYSAATCNPVATDRGTVIICSHDYSIRSFDQETGAQTWIYKPRKEELGPSYNMPVIKDGIAYFGSINGHVVGHDLDTGEKVFDVELRPGKTDPVFDSYPLLIADRLHVGTVGGNLYSVDLTTKKVAWKVALQPGAIFTRPAAWNGRLLVASMADKVFEIAPGK